MDTTCDEGEGVLLLRLPVSLFRIDHDVILALLDELMFQSPMPDDVFDTLCDHRARYAERLAPLAVAP
ncbi:hypothetical protein EYW49_17365 [Siculibacillus lacustris]|uniref:Uncharacterized protein n=1 Tax=Siculibacillus lacustris TaxID=1549641 RepID=A0A4Q9VK66_9HYPH|nr:hypothetical protein [Siculibacillus lacustris]TBW34869.1 hypothetical protein EYW49_17365 [Siculibacillus lacustris]